MSLTQHFFTKLPDDTQLSIANRLLEFNVLYRIPLFKMFFRTLESFGADRSEMLGALETASNFNGSFHQAWSSLGTALRAEAEEDEANEDYISAKDKYLRATLYHLVADWPIARGPIKQHNYKIALDNFSEFKRFHLPQIHKVEMPFAKGKLMANIRFPKKENKAISKPYPAVIIFQGNDSVKEFMVYIEDYALERGIATLTVDQPGFGESGMTGNLLDSNKAAMSCIKKSVNYLTKHPEINHDAIGVFGFSFGGFTSLYTAGLSKKIKAVSTIGAPMNLSKVYLNLSFLMKQRTFQWSGCQTDEEVLEMLKDMDIPTVVSRIKCPAKIYHGMQDEVVGRSEAKAIAAAIQSDVDLTFIEDGDHTCSAHLDELLPEIFDWMRDILLD
ncbi:MAG: dipeptidyl aminopeptidase/acylaminoacyl peptidase [Limisphaerales bacterium]|jgi:dipeptidyl aminopeptidase/acylaminoacyl peptidase